MGSWQLLTVCGNPKTDKSMMVHGAFTTILHLAPATLARVDGFDACPFASVGCRRACLNTAGRGGIMRKGERTNTIQRARVRRTRWLLSDREGFLSRLRRELELAARAAVRAGARTLAVRLNGTSDLPWETIAPDILAVRELEGLPVRFYDYTKDPARARFQPYALTFSRSETNEAQALELARAGVSVAVVFEGPGLPLSWKGFPVFDGDKSDARFLDPAGYIIGVRAKGKARKDRTGFVVRVA